MTRTSGNLTHRCHHVRIYVVNGKFVDWSSYELRQLFLSRGFFLFTLVYSILLSWQDREIYNHPALLIERLLFWPFSAGLVVATWYAQFVALEAWARRMGKRIVAPTLLLHLMPIIGLVYLMAWAVSLYYDAPEVLSQLSFWYYIKNYVITVLFEFFVVSWLLDLEGESARASEASEPHTSGQSGIVTISDQKFRADTVRYAKSEGHYLSVVTKNGSVFVRGTLADVASQFGPALGVQPHRSYWVAATAVSGLTREKGQSLLVLDGGEKIPVARNQRAKVSQWIQENLSH